MKHLWQRVAASGGHHLDSTQIERLKTYRRWLLDEAIPAGGLGPDEIQRIDARHIADSLLFSFPLRSPDEIWDLGTGVGLPGIPLAIIFPQTRVFLVDRSRRRLDLAARAKRMLGLDNTEVISADIRQLTGPCGVIVSRASLSPERMGPIARRLLTPDGIAILGGSWVEAPVVDDWETMKADGNALDRTVWLLIMRRQ